jgi:MFS transporter, DHA1 family, solute carrier family 18 (vesicular amine transporter), member 1/2
VRPRPAIVVNAITFMDALLLFAVVPLLPSYVRALSLSKTEAGLIVGAYSAAVLVAAGPVGHFADRFGARRMTIAGAALLAVSTIGFGLADSFWLLMLARVGQGLSSAVSWTAGMGWLSSSSPPARRGRALGTAMAFANAGALLGPVAAGPLGSTYGLRAPFVVLGSVSGLLFVAGALSTPGRAGSAAPQDVRAVVRAAVSSPAVAVALAVMGVVALVSGTLETLIPLRLGGYGYTATDITAVLTAAGVTSVITNAVVGRLFDRIGGVGIAMAGLLGSALGLAVLVVFESPSTLLAITYVLVTPAISSLYAVCFPMCAAGADAVGIGHSSVFGMINIAWGFGFMVGPAAGAAIASATSDQVVYALLLAIALFAASRMRSLALSE